MEQIKYSSLIEQYIHTTPNWLTRLQDHYAINAVVDGDLVSLKYNQIESPMHEPIVQECRGLVVHVPSRTVLAHPYNKFWNHGEALAAQIDWSTARVLEKLDGSLMTLYWHTQEMRWAVASSGHPTAGGPMGDVDGMKFRDLFWQTWNERGMWLPLDIDTCFMFKLCTAANRVVVKHDRPRLVLHGERNLKTGRESSLDRLAVRAHNYNWEVVKSFPISSIADCLAAADTLDPLACEGFIVVDERFNRVKIKSPRYVLLHHMKGEATLRRAIELWQTGEASELLSVFPEMSGAILPVHERLDRIAQAAATGTAQALLRCETRKDFALEVKAQIWSAIAFKLYAGPVNVDAAKGVMRAASLASLERMLESEAA